MIFLYLPGYFICKFCVHFNAIQKVQFGVNSFQNEFIKNKVESTNCAFDVNGRFCARRFDGKLNSKAKFADFNDSRFIFFYLFLRFSHLSTFFKNSFSRSSLGSNCMLFKDKSRPDFCFSLFRRLTFVWSDETSTHKVFSFCTRILKCLDVKWRDQLAEEMLIFNLFKFISK